LRSARVGNVRTASAVRRVPRRGEIWVAQFETPVSATEVLLRKARAAGATTILNLAPMVPHRARLLKLVDIAVLNEIELAQTTGARITARSSTRAIAAACRTLGARIVIATLGRRGLVMVGPEGITALPAFRTRVVDTTGAGDCFNGVLAAHLAWGTDLSAAVRDAVLAASLSVGTAGAREGMPDVDAIAEARERLRN